MYLFLRLIVFFKGIHQQFGLMDPCVLVLRKSDQLETLQKQQFI